MKKSSVPNAYYSLYNNYYLTNSYKCIIRSRTVHFLFALIEVLLNISQELYIFVTKYNLEQNAHKNLFRFFLFFPEYIHNLTTVIKIILILFYVIVFIIIYFFLGKFKYKKDNLYTTILYNILDLFYFRILMIFFLDLFFCLPYTYFFILLLLVISHLYITFYYFCYNHLYVFVPAFIEYPFDEFSSLFDIFLLVVKILLSINANSKNICLKKFSYIVTFIFQIYCCIYFSFKLIHRSYLFMKNQFLNKAKTAFFFIQTFILFLAELIGKNGILNTYFLVIIILIFVIMLLYIFFMYEPKLYIRIRQETPDENMYFFLYIISNERQPCFIIENTIKKHYEFCGICNLCKRFQHYINLSSDYEIVENDNINFINKDKFKRTEKLINIFFFILYDGKDKYFPLIKEMILTFQNKEESLLNNSSYFFINLSLLIFSALRKKNYVLALNIKIILDVINNENRLLDIHEAQIKEITLCNEFLSLVRSTLNLITDIMKTDENKPTKLIKLSSELNKMKNTKYKEILSNRKNDDISNSKNIIYLCSLLYEEIFNVILNINQVPLRDNYQILEDNFINNDKIERIISLALNLTDKNCKIIRAGKDLYNYKNNNLFDLIPITFKDYLQNTFISRIFDHFGSNINQTKKDKKVDAYLTSPLNNFTNLNAKYENKIIKRITLKNDFVPKIIDKYEYMEFNMIISQNISSRIFYRLLILRLTPLFNYEYNSLYILLDGSFRLCKNTIMTMQDSKNRSHIGQRIISVSKPELEFPPGLYRMSFNNYLAYLEKKHYKLSKFLDFIISKKLISIYHLTHKDKDKDPHKRPKKTSFFASDTLRIDMNKDISKKNIDYFIEETASVKSQQNSSSNLNFTSGFNIKTKKKENIYQNSNLFKLEMIIYLMIPIIIIFIIVEIIHLLDLKQGDYNNDYSLLCFNEFYKLYFQLFSTILSVVCIKNESGCFSIMSLYSKKNIGLDYYFNTTLFLYGQSQVLFKTLLEKRNNLLIIHKNIGKNKYTQIFEKKVDYTRIYKNYSKNKTELSLMKVNMIFTEAILISINSFQILTNNTINEPIYLLNKKDEPFLFFDIYGDKAKDITDFQKELYEMILNYKIFWDGFRFIYFQLLEALRVQTNDIKLYVYLYFHISYAIIVLIIVMLYIYMRNFEKLIVKILNYVNMIIVNKDDKFNFFKEFSKKIENLNIILEIYNENPIKAVQNLISSYNKYGKYLLNKKRNIYYDLNKKYNKKITETQIDNEIFPEVPKHQQIIHTNEFSKLYIMFHYYIINLLICIIVIISYVVLLLIWRKYYLIKDNLYSLLKKDTQLEMSFFKALNIYDLMIFDNRTLDELAKDIFYEPSYEINDDEQLIKSFYDDLYLAFNFEIEINSLINDFSGFPFFNFTCENLYDLEEDNLKKLESNSEIQKIGQAGEKMLRICQMSKIDEYNDKTAAYQRHYQSIIHSVSLINDFSYSGLIEHLKNSIFGEIYLNFGIIIMYITDIINVKLHKVEYDNLLDFLSNYLIANLVVIIFMYFSLMGLVIFFYIDNFKKFCERIILLKQVFQICEVHEQ